MLRFIGTFTLGLWCTDETQAFVSSIFVGGPHVRGSDLSPTAVHARATRLQRDTGKGKVSVDYVAVQQALGTYSNKHGLVDGDLVPACNYSTTYGPDQERLMVDGHRVLYRNGFVDPETNQWVERTGPPAPHMYDVGEAMKVAPLEKDDETPQMIIDSHGFPWRAEHVLEGLGLERNRMDSPEYEAIEIESGDVKGLPKPWEGPLTATAMKKATFSKKLKRDSRVGCELDDERWLVHYTKLVNFRARFGHADVPHLWAEDRALGRWVVKQRVLYRQYVRNNYFQHEILPQGEFGRKVNTLSPWRIQMLYDVGFSFKIKLRWEDRYAQLARFFVLHGHTRVPCSDNLDISEEEYPGLYMWIQQQRSEYQRWQNGVPETSMSKERFDLLNKVGLDMRPLESSWGACVRQLQEFRQTHGHIRVSKKQDFELAMWLINQRKQYRLYQSGMPWESSLTSERIDELNKLGMDWDPIETRWQNQYEALSAFLSEYGHTNVPSDYPENQSLSFWVQKQRRNFREGALKHHHEMQLKDLNFVFDMHKESFNRGLEKLTAYIEETGDRMIGSSCPDKELQGFAQSLRNQYRKRKNGESTTLTEDRLRQLNESGFVWNAQSTAWEDHYDRLLSFKTEFGHCNVPTNYPDSSLYTFVTVQRRNYKRLQSGESKALTPQRFEKLDAIGFAWNTKEARWMERFSELQDFHKQKGHCRVPDKYKANEKLGVWVRNQRVQYRYLISGKKSSLTPTRVEMLEKLSFVWNVLPNK